MKKIFIFLAAVAIVTGGCSKKSKPAETDNVPAVSVGIATQDSVTLHKSYPGYIYAADKADVVALVNGRILNRHYDEGAYVEKGQVLFTIESTTYRDAKARAEAAVTTARSQLDYATRQYEAMKTAYKSDAVSEMDVIQAENSKNAAAASLASAEANLNTANTNLAHCTVRAPISGHVTAATMSRGNYVSGEGSPVTMATIYNDTEMKVRFEVEDGQYLEMAEKTAAKDGKLYKSIPLVFDNPDMRAYTADLYYMAPSVNSSTGTLTLEGTIRNPKGELKDGMYVKVDLPYAVDRHATIINDAAISTDQAGEYIYLVNDSNRIVYTPVETGELYQDTLRIINKGVRPGDRYVSKALLTVRAGQKVKPVK